MKVTHTLTIEAKCPVDDSTDIYECVVRTERLITVEQILAEAKALSETPIFQEALCESLSQKLGCEVALIGMHSGVRTEVVCGGE